MLTPQFGARGQRIDRGKVELMYRAELDHRLGRAGSGIWQRMASFATASSVGWLSQNNTQLERGGARVVSRFAATQPNQPELCFKL